MLHLKLKKQTLRYKCVVADGLHLVWVDIWTFHFGWTVPSRYDKYIMRIWVCFGFFWFFLLSFFFYLLSLHWKREALWALLDKEMQDEAFMLKANISKYPFLCSMYIYNISPFFINEANRDCSLGLCSRKVYWMRPTVPQVFRVSLFLLLQSDFISLQCWLLL